ncbi:Kinesin-like protein KIF1C, partial [Durusdinium trenchii]
RLCRAELGAACVDVRRAEVLVKGAASSGYLHQCGDSYGEWRRIRTQPAGRMPPGRGRGRAWILYVSPLAMSNLWHLLHILLPALHAEHDFDELLIDGLHHADGGAEWAEWSWQKLRSSFAWPFLQSLAGPKELVLLGAGGGSDEAPWRCYERVDWGYEAVALFGRHKGHLSTSSIRRAVQQLERSSSFGGPVEPSVPRTPRLLLIERPPPARRAVVNGEALRDLLRSSSWCKHLMSEWADFAEEPLRSDVRGQWKLASQANILMGAHGAGLAWSAFMHAGSILVELLPFLHVLHDQLCRVGDGEDGAAWDSTPMYAYGGLALLTGLHHVCILGLPMPGQQSGSLGHDLATWWSSDIYVDTAAVNRTLVRALNRLSRSRTDRKAARRVRVFPGFAGA